MAVVTDTLRVKIPRGWGVFPGFAQTGRYAVCESSALCLLNATLRPQRPRPIIDERAEMDMGVEFNLQFSQLTLKSHHLQALDEPMSSDYDLLSVFGPR